MGFSYNANCLGALKFEGCDNAYVLYNDVMNMCVIMSTYIGSPHKCPMIIIYSTYTCIKYGTHDSIEIHYHI